MKSALLSLVRRSSLALTLLSFAGAFSSVRAEDWPRFRGPTGQGTSTEGNLPVEWSDTSAVRWKTEIPGQSWSSPIVWNDRIFVTTATDEGTSCRIVSLDVATGKVLWNIQVFQQELKRKENKNSYATPTPVADGAAVYAVFGDGSFAAVDFNGRVLWTHRDVKFYSQHGLGASPVLAGDLVIMPFDGSSTGEDKSIGWQKPSGESFILALDKGTGKERWRGRRGMSRIAHGTPILVQAGGRELLLSNAGDVVQGFEPGTGERLWSVPAQGEGVVPSLSFGDGLVYSASGFEKSTTRGIRLEPEPKIVWEQTQGVPKMSSFIYASPFLFSITEGGIALCQKGDTGEIVWKERVGGAYSASPVLAEGHIYFLAEDGETTIVEAAPQFKIVGRSSVKEKCQASMAVSGGRLFIRGEKHLFCIGR